ncbi:MAG: hypothetical protein U0105_21775 [Candidatus Obscuribacterales bacterium]
MTTNLTKSHRKTRRLAAFAAGLLVLCGAVTGEVLAKDHTRPGSRYKVKLFPPLVALQPKLDTSQTVRPVRLTMRVTKTERRREVPHAAKFPPLPEFLQAGNVWDEDKVLDPTASGENIWYKVPKWFAGEFSYGPMTELSETDLKTHKSKVLNKTEPGISGGRVRGILVDKSGAIWQKAYGGSVGLPNDSFEGLYRRRYDDELTGSMLSPTQYVEHSAGVDFYISTKTNKIIDVERWERIRDFSFAKGVVTANVSEETFDTAGKPLTLAKYRSKMNKQNAFVPLKPGGGKNEFAGTYAEAVDSLRRYLKASGQSLRDAPAPAPSAAQ